ncbi:MAG: ATP-binding cassette domain-containing protein [Bdellovibrio sp.]|nr:ATP-binding cassette domain-containing protein [Bdellovibrio sp.]
MELRLRNIKTAFFNIKDLHIASGERLLIKGPSGTGKTTLLHLLAGLYLPSSGEVLWDKTDISTLSENQVSHFRKSKMSLIFQNLNLLPYLTALENIELGGASGQLAQEKLNQVGLAEKSVARTQSLSLGEQQRVAVARSLAQSQEVLLADEPTSSLDDVNAEQVTNLLFNGSSKQSIIMVSHDHRVEKFFTRIVDMKEIMA